MKIRRFLLALVWLVLPAFVLAAPTRALVNLSALVAAGGGGAAALSSSFTIEGSASKTMLIRAVGPTLGAAPFNTAGTISDPALVVYNGFGQKIAENDNWGSAATSPAIVSASSAVGAFTLLDNSKDAVLLVTLAPGTYTARVDGVSGATGTAMLEVYDADTVTLTPRVAYLNLNTRIASAGNVVSAGFVVGAGPSQTVLIRGLGPALAASGVSGTLGNPSINLFSGSTSLASNDNWGTAAANASIASAAATAGLRPLADGSNDAALVTTLAPGNYTVQLSGAGSTTGNAVIEIAVVDADRTDYAPALLGSVLPVANAQSGGATLASLAIGRPAVSYQWSKNGAVISGATNPSFFVSSLAGSDAANYSVALSNSAGNVSTASLATTVWSQLNPVTSTGSFYSIAFSGSVYAAAGDGGIIYTSTDAATWSRITPSSGTIFRSIVYAGGKFVAVGTGGVIRYSTDNGATWPFAASSQNITTNQLNGVLHDGTRFVAVGANSTVIYSADGITWTAGNLGTASLNLTAVAFKTAGNYVATVATGAIYTTADVTTGTWSLATSNTTAQLNGVGFVNDRFIAVGNTGIIRTSTTGTGTWNTITSPTTSTLNAVGYNAGTYVITGGNTLLTSTAADASSWTIGTFLSAGSANSNALLFANGQFVSVGFPGTVVTSTTGASNTWTLRSGVSTVNFNDTIYANGRFVAVGSNGGVLTSTDGVSASSIAPAVPALTNTILRRVAYGAGTFVAVGDSGTIITSQNGTTWVNRSFGTTNYSSVVYAAGKFVAAGASGVFATSTDGQSWTAGSGTIGATTVSGLAFGGSSPVFVAVSVDGGIYTSPDAVTWTAQTSKTTNALNNVRFTGSQFIAVGALSTILTSVDGQIWNSRGLGSSGLNLIDVAHGGGLNVAVHNSNGLGFNSAVFLSPDGATWTSAFLGGTAGSPVNFFAQAGITYGNGSFFVASNSGIVARTLPNTGLPGILTQPVASSTIAAGGSTTLSVATNGLAGATYQWYRGSSGDTSSPISGATSASFTANTSARFWVRVSGASSPPVDSASAAVTGPAPTITTQPVATTITAGQGSSLSVVAATTGAGPLVYQWRKFGSPLAGVNGSSLALTATTMLDAGYYDVIVSDGLASIASKAVRVDVVPDAANYGTVYRPRPNAPRIEINSGNVTAIAVDPSDSNKIYVAGEFTRIDSTVRLNVARFLANGSFDSSWSPVSVIGGGSIRALLVESDGLIIAGDFTSIGGTPRGRLAKLSKTDGSLITSFASGAGASASIYALSRQTMADSSIRYLVGGSFSTFNGTTVNRLIRIDNTGAIDPAFVISPTGTAGFGSDVRAILVNGSGDSAAIYVGGLFTSHHGVNANRNRLVRLTVHGAYDSSFNVGTGLNGSVFALALSGTGATAKLYAGGQFTSVNDVITNRNRIARFDANGAYDTSFAVGSGFGSDVNTLALDTAGNVYVGGAFTSFNNTTTNRNRLLRLTSGGLYDTAFNNGLTAANGTVNTMLLLEDSTTSANSRLLLGGAFTTWNGTAREGFARLALDSTGTLDTAPAGNFRRPGFVYAAEPAPGGKWYIGGTFSHIDDAVRNHFARLNADGTLDSTFASPGAGFNSSVNALSVQGDGRIVVGGNFSAYAGTNRGDILRLLPDATLDTSFNPGSGFNGSVTALQLLPDGRIVANGTFTTLNGVTRNRLARLLPDGALDTTFDPVAGFTGGISTPGTLALQSDGKLLVGGSFTTYNGTTANGLVRVLDTGLIDATYNAGGAGFASSVDVRQIATRLNDQLVTVGGYTTYNGTARSRTARITDSGALDTVFAPNTGANNLVTAFHLQSDDKTILAGFYNAVLGVTRNAFSRITSTGTLDSSFIVPTAIGPINSINVLRPDASGNLLVGATRLDFTEFLGRGSLVFLEPAPVPAITTQPVAQTGTVGGSATFSVSATGENLTYQWLKNGAAIPLATGTSLALTSLTLADVANYSVVVTNLYGTVTSSAVALSGSAPLPTITAQPVATSGAVGGSTTITVTATGAGTLGYQWRKFGVPVAGATTATLSLTNLGLEAAGYYDVVINDGLSVRTSAGASVSVASTAVVGAVRPRASFEPRVEFSSAVFSFAPHESGDGRFYAAGGFTTIDGTVRQGVARFLANGNLDTTWTPALISGHVNAIAVQADGKIVLGGNFAWIDGRNSFRLGRLNADGTIDDAFTTAIGSGLSGTSSGIGPVTAIVIQPVDQKILVAGSFTALNTAPSNRILRLIPAGTIDSSFAIGSGFDNAVTSVALQPDGKIVAVGNFTTFNGAPATRIARLTSLGALDTTLVTGTGFEFAPSGVAVQSDNKIVVVGNFVTYNGLASNGIVRLDSLGARETGFPSGVGFGGLSSTVGPNTVLVQADGALLIGGSFTSYNGSTINRLVRIAGTDGAIDTTLNATLGTAGVNNTVRALLVQPTTNQLLVGGSFNLINTTARFALARFNSSGALDTLDRSVREPGFVYAVQPVSGGKFLIGGQFSHLNGAPVSSNLVRIDSTGVVDSSFVAGSGFNGAVRAIVQQGNGNLVVGGQFTAYNGVTSGVTRLVRLSSNGTLDSAFSTAIGSGLNNTVVTLVQQPDGRILAGGTFTTFNGVTVNRLARFSADGLPDTAFSSANGTGFNNTVGRIAVLPDGGIYVGGSFTSAVGVTRNGLVRILPAGGLDSTFNVGSGLALNSTQSGSFSVNGLALQSDGNLVVGGFFGSYNGYPSTNLFRVTPTGALDLTYLIGTGPNATVTATELQADGRLLVGGSFNTFNGARHAGFVRLSSAGALDPSFGVPFSVGTPTNTIQVISGLADGSLFLGQLGRQDYINRVTGALTFLESAPSPAFLTVPFGGTFPAGSTNLILSASAVGNPPLSYQWQRANVALVDNTADILGSKTNTLSFVNTQAANAGVYTLTVTDSLGASITTPPVTIAIRESAPVLGTISGGFGPVAQAGSATYLSVSYSGTTPTSVVWTKDGAPVTGGFYGSGQLYLPLAPARVADAGVYQVSVTNSLGTISSAPTRLWVTEESGWTPHNPLPSPQGLNNVYVANNQFFAGGIRGARFSSADGIAWNQLPALSQNNVFGHLEGNGRRVLIGSLGFVATSTDGNTWKTGSLPTYQPVQGIAFGGGLFVVSTTYSASPSGGAKIFTSPDGEIWTERYSTNAFALNSLAFGNGTFAIFTGNAVVRSTDGITWTTQTAPATGSFVRFVNGQFLLASSGTGDLHVSTDALTWTTRSYGATGARELTYANNQYLLTGDNGLLLTSPDAVTWTRRTSGTTTALRSAAYNAGTWVVLGNTDFPATILTSTDNGGTWTNRTTSLTYSSLGRFATDGSTSLIVPGSGGTILRTTNGTSWSTVTSGVTDDLEGAAYGAGRYVVSGANGRILTSTNGTSWTPVTSGTTNYLSDVYYLNNTFLVAGDLGVLLRSADGVSWTSATFSTGTQCQGIAYGSGRYVAVFRGGVILTSTDAITWVAAPSGTTADITGVTFGNGKFLAATSGALLSSTDGLAWSSGPAPEIPNWDGGAIFLNGRYYAGAYGTNGFISSADGVTWTGHHLGFNYSDISGITVFNGRMYLSGDFGLILSTSLTPAIVQQPVGQVIANGSPITLRVLAAGSALPTTYQWRKGGTAIPGATFATFTIPSAARADAGVYDVVLTTTAGAAISSPSIVSVAPVAYPGQLAADPTWDPNPVTISTRTFAAVKLANGKFLAGGESVRWDGMPRTAIARLNADLTLDTSWTPPLINGIVYALAASSDGSVVYVGGDFTAVDGHTRPGLARLVGPNLNLDLLWRPLDTQPAGPSQVSALAVQDNGQLLVARLSFVTGAVTGTNVLRRLKADGSLDSTFSVDVATAVAGQRIHSLIAEPGADPKIAFGGSFTAVNGITRGGVARVNSTGATLDTAFGGSGGASAVQFLARLASGRYVVGGNFTSFAGSTRNRLAVLDATTGALDTTFVPPSTGTTNGNAHAAVELFDGRLLVFGNFTLFAGNNTAGFLRLNGTTGAFDSALTVGTGTQTVAFNISAAGRNMHGFRLNDQDQVGFIGTFNELLGQRRVAAARLNAGVSTTDASDVSKTLVATPSSLVHRPAFTGAAFLEKNGALTVLGSADIAGGSAGLGQILRVNPNGSIDSSFPGGTGFGLNGLSTFGIYRAARQGDGKIVATGDFNSYNGASVSRIVRINADGTRDTSFNPGTGPSNFIVTPVALANGKVALFGSMGANFAYNGSPSLPGNILRLNADGTRDTTFVAAGISPNIGFNVAPSFVMEIPNQDGPDAGSLLVVGSFTSYGGVAVPGIALLSANGTLDTTFTYGGVGPGGGSITGAQLLGPGRLALYGNFTSFNGNPANRVVLLSGDPLVVDPTFTAPAALDAQVNQLLQQEDGRLIAVGEFSSGPALRLSATGLVDSTFALQGITGFPGGSSGARFIMADDGSLYLHNTLVSLDYGAPRALVRFKGTAGAPTIAQAPLGGNLVVGSPFVLSVSAAGTAPYTYQWKLNNTAISGATDSVYFIPSATTANAGSYTVTVTGPGGNVTSVPATLAESTSVALTDQPSSRKVAAGATVQFAVSATTSVSGATLTYQWRKGANAIAGATTSSLTLTRVSAADAASYSVVVADGTGTLTSQSAVLTVNQPDPILWQQFTEFSTEHSPARTIHDGAGKVYAPWSVQDRAPDVVNGRFVGALARFDEATGALDTSFRLDSRYRRASHVVIQPDGKLLVAVSMGDASTVIRVTSSGAIDTVTPFAAPLFARSIRFITRQADGKVIVVATDNLDTNAPASAVGADAFAIYRLTDTGALDSTFTRATVNAPVFGPPVVDSTGRIYFAGQFNQVNGVSRLGAARLTSTGALDTTFPTGLPANFNYSQLRAVALQSGDRPVFVGDFFATGFGTGSDRVMALRFTSAGAYDSTFVGPKRSELGLAAGLRLRHLLIQPDDTILAVSDRLVRLTANGAKDTTFTPRAFGKEAFWISQGANGRLFFSDQTSIFGQTIAISTISNGLATTSATGAPDFAFQTGGWGRIAYPTDAALLSDGRYWIGGNFNRVGSTSVPGVALFNADGTPSVAQFDNGRSMAFGSVARTVNDQAFAIAFVPSNSTQGGFGADLVRINTDFTTDAGFTPVLPANYDLATASLNPAPGGKLILAQGFISAAAALNGSTGDGLFRLNANGTRDTTYTPALASFAVVERSSANGPITAIRTGGLNVLQVLADGSALVVATALDGSARLQRLTPTGAVDATFTAPSFGTITGSSGFTNVLTDPVTGTTDQFSLTTYSASDLIRTAAQLPDGKVYVGGRFQLSYANAPRGIARLNPNGTIDTTFTGAGLSFGKADAGPYVSALAVDSVGRLYVAGRFDNFNGSIVPGLFRLRADGVFDSGWNPGFAVLDAPRAAINLIIDGNKLHAFGTVGLPGDSLPAVHRVADISPSLIAQQGFETLPTGAGKLVTDPFSGFTGYSFINVAPNFSLGPITADPIQGIVATSPLGTGQAGYLGGAGTNLVPPASNTFFSATVFGGRSDEVPVNIIGSATPVRRISADFVLDRRSGTNSQTLAFYLYDARDLADPATSSFHSQVLIGANNVVSIADHDFAYAATSTTLSNNVPYRVTIMVNYNTATWSALIAKIDGTATHTLATDRPINTNGFVLSGWTTPGTFDVEMGMVASATNKALLDRFIFDNLVVSALPDPNGSIASVTPATATGGTLVTLTGSGFTGATAVKFNGVDAAFTLVSDTQITATVPALATTGAITVVKPGSTLTAPGTFTITPGPNLLNLSSRGLVGTGENALLANFTVEGGSKTVLLRAVGPSLAVFGVGGTLADPVLTVHDGTGAEIARNDDWPASLSSDFATVGAFPFSAGSKDSALKLTLAPGTYTARVSGAGGTTGVAIIEVYDVSGSARLAHLAVRAQTEGASAAGGFVVGSGAGTRSVLIRAVGSPLVTALGAASNPVLSVFNSSSSLVATNDNWGASAELTAATAAAGALPLASNDSALLLSLAPGSYSVQASAATSGFVLLEVHVIDTLRAPSFKPALLAPLLNTSVFAGTPLILSAPVLAKSPAVTYVWKKDGAAVTSGVPLAGSPGALQIPAALATDTGLYTVEMTNAAGTTISAPVTVSVTPPAGYSATQAVAGSGGYTAGGTVTITNTLTYAPSVGSGALGWSVVLPAGWSYVSSSGQNGNSQPADGATGTISWAWTSVPSSPVTFTYTLAVPAGETVARTLTAFAIARPASGPIVYTANPNPLVVSRISAHSADTNADFRLSLLELTRVIELFNTRNGTTRTGAYAVAATTSEDGFVADPARAATVTASLAKFHSADSNRDGLIDVTELSRVIQLYNVRAGTVRTGAYRGAVGTEDGYDLAP